MSLLLDRLRSSRRSVSISTVDDYAQAVAQFGFGGVSYPVGSGSWQSMQLQQTLGPVKAEPIPDSFAGLVQSAYKSNGLVFALMLARMRAFSSVRFTFQRINQSKPSELFGSPELQMLERPWPGGTTQDLLARAIQDADVAGNSYWTLAGGRFVRLRPDWTFIVTMPRMVRSMGDAGMAPLGDELTGYVYVEGGLGSGFDYVWLEPGSVAHYAPIPDPEASYRGMSWLTPVLREVQADELMTRHRRRFFEHGATPNMVVKHPVGATMDAIKRFAQEMASEYGGVGNAYKTLNLYPGADATVVGKDMRQIDFAVVQAAGETRVASAAGVPPIIAGLSKGLDAATYSNYGQARRAFSDGTMHPLWQDLAGSFEPLMRPVIARFQNPSGVRLWYDARDVPLLREDAKEQAEISEMQARTIRTYVDGGYTPDSARRAVESNDLSLLDHSGLLSVQLQEPGSVATPADQMMGDE